MQICSVHENKVVEREGEIEKKEAVSPSPREGELRERDEMKFLAVDRFLNACLMHFTEDLNAT